MDLDLIKANLILKAYGATKIPLLGFANPKITLLTRDTCQIRLPLNFLTKNHLGSMYFGALCMGAEVSVGAFVAKLMHEQKAKVNFVFKDFKAEFFRRAEGDVLFVCQQGLKVQDMLNQALNSDERVNGQFKVRSYVPLIDPNEAIAEFELTLSMKKPAPKGATSPR